MNTRWQLLPIPRSNPEAADLMIRLNGLGSLYFFNKFILKRDKLGALHRQICSTLESDNLRYLLEMPRDHLKTTILTEGRTIWRSLPFTERDEAAMRELGYGDEWIAWMRRIHDPSRRTAIVSETAPNAAKLGIRFDWHYQSNETFRKTFPEIIPTNEMWNQESKAHKCKERGPNGEGTYDFLGVGTALQSRHYTDVVEDDVVGRDAEKSITIMNDTIDYHRLLIGAFVSYAEGTWTVVNNRWAPNDLSGWIRSHNDDHRWLIESHSALGGCCPNHPKGHPIFPEEFTVETLDEIRRVQGPYFFSHQYLNLPVNPEDCVFDSKWLRYYFPVAAPNGAKRHNLRHEVSDGEVIADINPQYLVRSMIVDPNHRQAEGRSRHAIVITGLDPETDKLYLLDVWAESKLYEELVVNIYRMAEKWGMVSCWIETVGFQSFLKYHMDYRSRIEGRSLKVNPLRTDHSPNAKRTRIESLMPVFQEGRFWCRHDQSAFIQEYEAYPNAGVPMDVLDCLGYAPQTWNAVHAASMLKLIHKKREQFAQRKLRMGY